MGRPTDKPMPVRVGFRLDTETLNKLDKYCNVNNISRSKAIRKAILRLIDDN
ncbi:hypothetical protein SH1V18_23080 [Vallitalea longa]|uniref:Ribbon-helix-helix protein CopG domain-containing protein n=2 Tax=Vallitalea longa TaxID=2936439 RepID=A0A9W5YCJ2_9FIRM|nr:hypothetical protein SH1V18_23080 [Vallitalea longa]